MVKYLYLIQIVTWKKCSSSFPEKELAGKHWHEHITPILARLHWLPVKYRVHFKLAVITFNALTTQQPRYLAELLSVHVLLLEKSSVTHVWCRGLPKR